MSDAPPKPGPLTLAEASALTEASAFRITPKYVYGFKHKDGNKAGPLVPVHIKHANVWKHFDDLVDPEPGTPQANLVIGEIPPHYKAASDLKLKDPSKTLKDVMTKEGQSSAAEPLTALSDDPPAPVVNPATMTKADVQAQLGGAASVPLDAYLSAISFNPTSAQALLKNTQITSVLLKVYGANWKEQAAALGFDVPGVAKVAPEVANAAKILGFKPGSADFKALESIHKHGNDVDATIALAGGDDATEDDMTAAAKSVNKVIAAAKKAQLVSVAPDDEDEDIDVVAFKAVAASPMLVPAALPPPVLPTDPGPYLGAFAPISPKTASTPAAPPPAPPGFVAFNADALNKGPDGVAIQNPEGHIFVKKDGKWWLGGIHAASIAALDGQAFKVVPNPTKPPVAGPAYSPAPPPPAPLPKESFYQLMDTEALDAAPDGKAIQDPEGLIFQKHNGKWYNVSKSGQLSQVLWVAELAGQTYKNVGSFPVPASMQTASAPTVAPTAPLTKNGLGLAAIPPLATLTLAGDAKATLGGAHPKKFVKDGAGNTFLLKIGQGAPGYAAEAYSKIAAKVFGAENAVPVVTGTVSGVGTGSVQPVIPNIKTDLSKVDLTTLTHPQLARLMKERVLDWALASHDAKAANFLLTNDGQIVGIDKDQSLKFIGQDSLSSTYKPNPSPQLHGALFDLFKQKKIDLPVGAMLDVIEKVEDISDDAWLATLGPYLGAVGGTPAALTKLKDTVLARKKNLRTDLEALFTEAYRARGDIGPTDTFEFDAGVVHLADKAKKKKKVDLGGLGGTPPMGSILSPPQVPSLSSLVPLGAATGIGGAGEKFFFSGPDGKWLVKLARSKNKAKIEPFRIAAQEMFSQVSSVVRPGKSIPVGNVPEGHQGIPASIQPWMDGATPLGAAASNPALLTPGEQKDVAEEHALDWLMSQHDTHAANFVRRADGTLLSVDKEQGFKYVLPGTKDSKDGDKLSVDYHPNGAFGQSEPFYNKFWKSFADGSMSFDPKEMTGAIERIEAISDSDYTKLLSKFASEAKFKDDPKKVAEFLALALARKQNIRKDFESFIGGLYEKRTKKKGTFTFAGGWDDGSAEPDEPEEVAAGGVQPQLEVVWDKKGKLGASGVELFTPAGAVPPTAPKPPPTPAGYPDPPPGKMWSLKTASTFFSTGPDGALYKTKPPKGPDGAPDLESKDIIVKLKGLNAAEAEESLKQLGAKPISVKAKGGYVIAMMSKDELTKAQASPKSIGVLVDLPSAPPPPSGVGTAVPKPGVLKNVVINEKKETTALLKNIEKAKLSVAKVMLADGDMVEHNSMMVQRHIDAKGKEFYRVSFKLRKPAWESLKGPNGEFDYPNMDFDVAKDAWVEKTGKLSGGTFEAKQWKSGNSRLSVGTGAEGKRAMMGLTIADVYPEPGQSVEQALKTLLDQAKPGFGSSVLKPPTKEDLDKMKLSALLWSVAPQENDQMSEADRTPEKLRATLKAKGYTDAELNSIRLEKVGFQGRVVPVLPGRSKKILKANPKMKYLRHGFSSVDKLVKHLRGGSTAVGDRFHLGIGTGGTTSGNSDVNTGGADYLFTKPGLESNTDFAWGNIQTVVDPTELDRLDIFSHSGDQYGKTNGPFLTRAPLESSSTQSKAELMVRHGFSPNKIIKIRVNGSGLRQQVIAALKSEGITEFNGMSLEDLVVASDEFYKDHLKPAGY